MSEIWKDIKGYEGLYQVSNLGRIRSLPRIIEGKILKACTEHKRGGYQSIRLSKNSEMKCFKIHRLVAEAFIENPENKLEVDHINTIKTDNRVENLRWTTHKENCNNKTSISKRKYPKWLVDYQNINSTKAVKCVETGIIYHSMQEAAKAINISTTGISLACRKIRKTSGGYHWELLNNSC